MNEHGFVIVVEGCPKPGDGPELLELILAAASLDLALTVVLRGNAVELFTSPETTAWRQLNEHGLATVCVVDEPADTAPLPPGLERLGRDGLRSLEAAGTVVAT